MLLHTIAVVLGLALLVWSADRFITGAAALARLLGVAPLVIGLTIVALGTSAPEMFVSALSAAQGQAGLSIGNAIGSNITNIGLILGITALLRPLSVHSRIIRRELPILTGLVLLSAGLVLDGELGRLDGAILLVGLVALLLWLYRTATTPDAGDALVAEIVEELPSEPMSRGAAIGWTLAGLLLLAGSAQVLIWGAVGLATAFGVSDLVIGLTIVALGTSLPELAASLAGAFRGEHDLAIGNVLGSNMFNLVVVLPLPGLIAPGAVPDSLLTRDMAAMMGLTLVLFVFCVGVSGRTGHINRVEAAALLAGFAAYELILLRSELGA